MIGTTTHADLGPSEGRLKVELAPGLHHHLDVDEGSIEVPADWVAAARRDAIRRSRGLQDPRYEPPRACSKPEARMPG